MWGKTDYSHQFYSSFLHPWGHLSFLSWLSVLWLKQCQLRLTRWFSGTVHWCPWEQEQLLNAASQKIFIVAQCWIFCAFVQQEQHRQNVSSCCKLEEELLEGAFQSISVLCRVFGAGSSAGAMQRPAALWGRSGERLQGALAAQLQRSELFTMNKASDEFGLILPLWKILQQTTVSSKLSHYSISFCNSRWLGLPQPLCSLLLSSGWVVGLTSAQRVHYGSRLLPPHKLACITFVCNNLHIMM